MHTFYVSLTSIDDVKKFANAANYSDCRVYVYSDRYQVDAKSIMGLFSLDLAKPVKVEFHGSDAEKESFQSTIASYLVRV